ncbi:MAG: DUF6503 family protein [Cyclobacteriaceae bacterium]
MMKQFIYLFCFSFLISCGPNQKAETAIDHYALLPDSYKEVLKVHGGLEKWRSFGTLEYDLKHEKDSIPTEHYTLDLRNRKDLTVADSFQIGFDGNEVWVAPNKKTYKGRSARFYHNLYSYFFTIPFVVADPGVIYAEDTLTVNGKLYDVISVSFEEGVGDADEDAYKMLIDPTTKRFEILLYTVTYYTGEAHENFNALSYEDWVDVNGLQFPSKLVGYKYTHGTTGDKRYEVTFNNIQLKEERPNQDIFNMPTRAEIDSLNIN